MNTVYKNHKCIKQPLKTGATLIMDPKVQVRNEGNMIPVTVLVMTLHAPNCPKVVES
jgi:hypothetical protein